MLSLFTKSFANKKPFSRQATAQTVERPGNTAAGAAATKSQGLPAASSQGQQAAPKQIQLTTPAHGLPATDSQSRSVGPLPASPAPAPAVALASPSAGPTALAAACAAPSLKLRQVQPATFVFAPQGGAMAAIGEDSQSLLLCSAAGKQRAAQPVAGLLRELTFAGDAQALMLAYTPQDSATGLRLTAWPLADMAAAAPFGLPLHSLHAYALSPGGSRLLYAPDATSVAIANLVDGRLQAPRTLVTGLKSEVVSVQWSHSGVFQVLELRHPNRRRDTGLLVFSRGEQVFAAQGATQVQCSRQTDKLSFMDDHRAFVCDLQGLSKAPNASLLYCADEACSAQLTDDGTGLSVTPRQSAALLPLFSTATGERLGEKVASGFDSADGLLQVRGGSAGLSHYDTLSQRSTAVAPHNRIGWRELAPVAVSFAPHGGRYAAMLTSQEVVVIRPTAQRPVVLQTLRPSADSYFRPEFHAVKQPWHKQARLVWSADGTALAIARPWGVEVQRPLADRP
jgi:hypothetical protein